ncbi:Transient receptor potential cation channel subfamily A member 1 [Orchesella cincta]|uniref:Transient receptor potential cation channel subfamily A member 1 n=1 Tax=Orchesella cincta TaxID=48709 RepID=A0A1D2MGZ2_ORCCI|nr:Transient receptor potential cation channel subfamily A member 1 [Orchesella cincta]
MTASFLASNQAEGIKQLNRFDFKGRTVLHYAALAVNLSDGENCVHCILKFLNKTTSSEGEGADLALGRRRHTQNMRRTHWKGKDVTPATVNYINYKDVDGETAISLAAKAENAKIVELLLLNSADVLSRNAKGERTLELIYSLTPSAIKALLDKSIAFEHGVDEDNFIRTERSYHMDFTSVIGYQDTADGQGRSILNPETLCLQLVNNKETASRKVILTHPLIRYFLDAKMERIRFISWSSLSIQMFWIALYIWHAVDIYYTCCEIHDDIYTELKNVSGNAVNETSVQLYCSDYPFDKASISHPNVKDNVVAWTVEMENIVYGKVTSCFKESDSLGRSIPLVILAFLIFITVLFQLIALRLSYFKLKNIILWLFELGLLITVFPTEAAFKFQFQIAAFAIVIALVVSLELVNKHIYWGIYIRVLMKLIKRFLAIMPLFFVIMLAFSISLRMVFPSISPSVEEFRNAMMEVFATVANGKVEWIEGHKYVNGVDFHFKATGLILFLVFYVTMILLLFRILIGFVVADTKKIQEEEELNEISNDLEEIYLIESLLLSRPLRSLEFVRNFSKKFILFPKGDDLELWLAESKVQKELRPKIRAIASKNPVKSREKQEDVVDRKSDFKKRFSSVKGLLRIGTKQKTPTAPINLHVEGGEGGESSL